MGKHVEDYILETGIPEEEWTIFIDGLEVEKYYLKKKLSNMEHQMAQLVGLKKYLSEMLLGLEELLKTYGALEIAPGVADTVRLRKKNKIKRYIDGLKRDKEMNPDHKLLEKWKRIEMVRMEIAWIEQLVDQKKKGRDIQI